MLGILSRRFFVLLAVLLLLPVLGGDFVRELAIINGDAVVAAFVADFLRYSMALLVLLTVVVGVAEDYEFRQFERLLTMPLARWQYVAAQVLVIAALCLLSVTPVAALLWLYQGAGAALYWAAAMWMETLLVGLLGLLAIMSLEKIPQAMFFSLAVYLLAKLSGLVELMLAESVRLSDGQLFNRAVEFVFGLVMYVLPGTGAFADSDIFFAEHDLVALLAQQGLSVAVYAAFILAVCLVDFYRKEFNL